MSAKPESCLQIYGERQMAITIAASAAVSIEDANRDIMSAEEKIKCGCEADIFFFLRH